MRNFNFKIDDELDHRIKEESDRSGVPMSEIARRGITRYLEESDRQRKRIPDDGMVQAVG